MSDIIDARGLSCPQPVIMIRKAMADKQDEYTMLVDNKVSVENVSRYAEYEGYNVVVKENGEDYQIICLKNLPKE